MGSGSESGSGGGEVVERTGGMCWYSTRSMVGFAGRLFSLNRLWLVGVETGARLSWDCIVGTREVLGTASTPIVPYSEQCNSWVEGKLGVTEPRVSSIGGGR